MPRWVRRGIGCSVVAGRHEIALPFAMAVSVLISTYFVRIQIMWRQAPITTAIVLAGWTHGSEITARRNRDRRVAEVMLGCVVGVAVSWMMSKLWPLPETPKGGTSPAIPRG